MSGKCKKGINKIFPWFEYSTACCLQVGNLPLLQNPFSQRVSSIIAQLRGDRRGSYYPSVYVVKEDGDPMLRALFLSRLVEDRMPHGSTAAGANQQQVSSGMSYFQWLGFTRAKCQ